MMSKIKEPREPLFHIIKRNSIPIWKSSLIRGLSAIFALIICALVTFLLTGLNPLEVYSTMLEGALGSQRRIWALLQDMVMLLCISLAVTPAFKMKFWNIGAEGQALMGGLATASCMILFGDKMPAYLLFPLMIVTSIAAGILWALIPAFFKAYWNTNETLFTLMMNYVAIQIVTYFCYKWSNPKGSGQIGVINASSNAGWFPKLGGQAYLLNIIIVLILAAIMYVYLKYSKHGYEISVVGESQKTARYIGINVKKVIIRTMILSGALCGITGLLLVSGTDHTITRDTVEGRGFTAIMVAWLGQFNPIYMLLTSLLIVALQKGAIQISTNFGLNDSFSEIITGIIIFFIIGSEFFINYQVKFRNSENKEVKAK
ncbi:MAG: ABC transporter permease [Clostridiales bacterium]|nr:ABC transporter permease [Clostridiales bacterium]